MSFYLHIIKKTKGSKLNVNLELGRVSTQLQASSNTGSMHDNRIGRGIEVATKEFDYTSNIILQCWHKKHQNDLTKCRPWKYTQQSTSSIITVQERKRLIFKNLCEREQGKDNRKLIMTARKMLEPHPWCHERDCRGSRKSS